MMQIRPVSDLRNNFSDIEKTVQNGAPVYLTKNGYGTMVVMSLEQYSALTNLRNWLWTRQTGRRRCRICALLMMRFLAV